MFGFRKSESLVTPRELPLPVRSPIGSGLESKQRTEYLEASAKIGLFGAAQLRMILEENSIEVFPLDKVCDYLDQIYRYTGKDGQSATWGWRGLRRKDCTDRNYGESPRHTFLAGPYRKEIPLPVLLTFDKIQSLMPEEEVVFGFISDEITAADRIPDPFLAVMTRNGRSSELIVVERWNEPGFRL